MRRNIPGTVKASSNYNDVEKHLDLAQLIIERCKRRVEYGETVVVLLDKALSFLLARNPGLEDIIEGKSIEIVRDGIMHCSRMRAANFGHDELFEQLAFHLPAELPATKVKLEQRLAA